MYRIAKSYHFSASHVLPGLAEDHPCSRLHGHNYVVEVELAAETLNGTGFVRDYRELDALKDYIDQKIDHRHLNDVLGEDKTSAECIARHFYDWCKKRWPEIQAVRVSETPRTWAEFRP
ncbi:MAG: 6-carboxytetrahydropterin synthase QueD [Alphaproteobacteria bacterium]|nr:6-carboxytetrahydropterin synthase QueD [Alphaproteobacteria bacterium]